MQLWPFNGEARNVGELQEYSECKDQKDIQGEVEVLLWHYGNRPHKHLGTFSMIEIPWILLGFVGNKKEDFNTI